MRKIFLIVCFLLLSLKPADIKPEINFDALEFQFFPCSIDDPIIELNYASLEKYSENEMVIVYEKVKYIWKNKSVLFKENKNLGCYSFLCIRWTGDYCFIY